MNQFTDTSCPPVGESLSYERGDGAKVELKITPPGCSSDKCCGGTCETQPAQKTNVVQSPVTKQKAKASITLPKGVPIKINPRANVHVRDTNVPTATRPNQSTTFNDAKVMDHPTVGGRVTAFILFYGGEEYHDLHKRCLTSLLATVPSDRVDLRVGSNALNSRSLDMIEEYVQLGFITKHYQHTENAYKYPVMREMFHDPDHPIETKWLLWFDDDSICDVEPTWLNILATHISQHHRGQDAHMIGAKFVWTTNAKQRELIENRPWYRGRPWRVQNGSPSPTGNKIIFATGGFWALTKEAMVAADIPDIGGGLTHTGGDWLIGEQLYQAGFGLKQFNGRKQFVRTSSVDRRGVTMPTIDQAAQSPPAASPAPASLPPLRRDGGLTLHVPPMPALSTATK